MTIELLEHFYKEHNFAGKGPLSVAIQLSRSVRGLPRPYNPGDFLTPKKGQVRVSGPKLKRILAEYDIRRILAAEGGRTSRGSLDNLGVYLDFLNKYESDIDWRIVEDFWITKIKEYFDAEPFTIAMDSSHSVRAVIMDLLKQAYDRQLQVKGTKIQGIMIQHLVGAKLESVTEPGMVFHHCASTNDQERGRSGDFDIGDVSIHVTTRPSEALLQKCVDNIRANRRPVIITLASGVDLARDMAVEFDVERRLEILDFVHFIVANIHERSGFDANSRRERIEDLVDRYNRIIDTVETDPSLKIEFPDGR